jgi:hypothetical protein
MPESFTRRDTLAVMASASPLLIGRSTPAQQPRGAVDDPLPLLSSGHSIRERERSFADKLGELSISITDFGAVGDGDPANAAVNTAAIRAAIAHASSLLPQAGGFVRPAEIFVPPGIFVVEPKALNPSVPTIGLSLRGTGWFSSTLRLAPGRQDERWMFDNTDGHELLAFPVFANLCFEGHDMSRGAAHEVPPNAGLMRIEGHNTAQGFRFENCLIQGFDTCLLFTGSNLTSENKFLNCKIFGCNTVAVFANQQSFNTDFIGTEIEEIYKSFFHFIPSKAGPAGGAVRVSNASLIPSQNCAIVRMDSSMLTQGVVIRDSRIEMRGNSRFFQGHTDLAYGELTIIDCGILNTESVGARRVAEVGPAQTLRFVRCVFNTLGQEARYAFIPQRNRYMAGPRLLWDDCQLPFDIAAKIENRGDNNHGGQASARYCRTNEGQGNDEGVIHAADFDLFGQGGTGLIGSTQAVQGADAQLRRKTIALKLGTSSWPCKDERNGATAETKLILPPYARIVRIVIAKDAQGRSAAPYDLRIRTAAGTTLFDTPAVAQNTALVARHDPEAENRMPYVCGDALPTRTIVLTCGPRTRADATERSQQGYAYLEYF